MPFTVEIAPSAVRGGDAAHSRFRSQAHLQAIKKQLTHNPTVKTRNRKLLIEVRTSFTYSSFAATKWFVERELRRAA